MKFNVVLRVGLLLSLHLPEGKPQEENIQVKCKHDYECRSSERCDGGRCMSSCHALPCGINAECDGIDHKAVCKCPRGHTGDPLFRCQPAPSARGRSIDFESLPGEMSLVNPCKPNPCGANARCRPGVDNAGRDSPICTCPPGFFGDALHSCHVGECHADSDCPSNRHCWKHNCEDPCRENCGVNARCVARNHAAVCSCPPGSRGDPFTQCITFNLR